MGRPTTFVGIVIVWFAAGIVFGIGGGQLCGVIGQRAPMVVSGDGCGRSTTPFLLWFPCGSSGLFLLGAGAHWLCGVASASFPAPCRAAPWTLVAAGRRRL